MPHKNRRILWWHDFDPSGFVSWYFRGISADGGFYGYLHVRKPDARYNRSIEGRLSNPANERFWALCNEIEASIAVINLDLMADRGRLRGNLLKGSPSDAESILQYVEGDEIHSIAAARFLEVIALLRPIVESFLAMGDGDEQRSRIE